MIACAAVSPIKVSSRQSGHLGATPCSLSEKIAAISAATFLSRVNSQPAEYGPAADALTKAALFAEPDRVAQLLRAENAAAVLLTGGGERIRPDHP